MRLAEPIVDMALAFIVFGVLVGRWLACRGRLLTSVPDIMRSLFPKDELFFSCYKNYRELASWLLLQIFYRSACKAKSGWRLASSAYR